MVLDLCGAAIEAWHSLASARSTHRRTVGQGVPVLYEQGLQPRMLNV